MRGVTPTYLLLYSSLCLPQRVLHPLTNGCYTNLPTAATNAPSLSVFLNGCYTNLPTVATNTPGPSLFVSLSGTCFYPLLCALGRTPFKYGGAGGEKRKRHTHKTKQNKKEEEDAKRTFQPFRKERSCRTHRGPVRGDGTYFKPNDTVATSRKPTSATRAARA